MSLIAGFVAGLLVMFGVFYRSQVINKRLPAITGTALMSLLPMILYSFLVPASFLNDILRGGDNPFPTAQHFLYAAIVGTVIGIFIGAFTAWVRRWRHLPEIVALCLYTALLGLALSGGFIFPILWSVISVACYAVLAWIGQFIGQRWAGVLAVLSAVMLPFGAAQFLVSLGSITNDVKAVYVLTPDFEQLKQNVNAAASLFAFFCGSMSGAIYGLHLLYVMRNWVNKPNVVHNASQSQPESP